MPNSIESGIFQRWEPPDTMFARYVGQLDVVHLRKAQIEVKDSQQGLPYFLILIDVSQLSSISSEARRTMTENGETARNLRATAIVGASFHFRALGTMVARAVAILNRQVDSPTRFFSTEAEARVWLAERRRSLASNQ